MEVKGVRSLNVQAYIVVHCTSEDVILYSGDAVNLKACTLILCLASPLFRDMFSLESKNYICRQLCHWNTYFWVGSTLAIKVQTKLAYRMPFWHSGRGQELCKVTNRF